MQHAAAWSRLVPLLDEVGVRSIAPHLPSCLPASDLDDAAFLRSVLDEVDGPLVLVGHSGSGFPITEVGEHPSVRHLVYLDGFLPDVGETMADAYGPGELDPSFAACIKLTKVPCSAGVEASRFEGYNSDVTDMEA